MIPINILKEVESLLYPEIEKTLIEFKTSKKEKGHALAPIIEECVCDCLVKNGYPITFERNADGTKKTRACSDLLFDGHFVNVKFGVSKGKGQPNISSINRMMWNLENTDCDSYYLIKIRLIDDKIHIYFIDILNHPDLITADTGTGQMMLKEEHFYNTKDLRSKMLTKLQKELFINDLYLKKARQHIVLREKQRQARKLYYENLRKQG